MSKLLSVLIAATFAVVSFSDAGAAHAVASAKAEAAAPVNSEAKKEEVKPAKKLKKHAKKADTK